MNQTAKVGVAQVPVELGNVRANLESLGQCMRTASDEGVRLLVFPECFLSGYMFENRAEAEHAAIDIDGPEVASVVSRCALFDLEIVVGFLERSGSRLYNSAMIVGPEGVIGVHRKRHLPHLGVDRFVDEPEEAVPCVFETRIGRVGVAICYEIRFPEVIRTLALRDADFIALPTNWPTQSSLLADHFTRVRAAENFVYLLVSNRADAEGEAEFLGKSQIVDPLGNVLVVAGQTNTISTAHVAVARARNKTITVVEGSFELSPWKDRRPATYDIR